jgi:PRTRC genetic system ThiF family protein
VKRCNLTASAEEHRHYLPDRMVASAYRPVPVILVGCGGTGSRILAELAPTHSALVALGHPGFHVTVLEHDIVTEANIGRQRFSPVDVGQNKAKVLVTRLNMFYGLDWRAHPRELNEETCENILQGGLPANTILITAVDNVKARLCAARIAQKTTYWIETGNLARSGQCIMGTGEGGVRQPKIPNTVGVLPTALDLYPEIREADTLFDQGPSCSLAQALERQDLLINSFVATCAVQLLWQGFRKGYITHHGAFINLASLTVRSLTVDPLTWQRMGWTPRKKARSRRKRNHLPMAA